MDQVASNDESVARGARMKQAFDRCVAEFMAMTPAELVPVNVDILKVYTRAHGSLATLGPLRQEVLDVSHMDLSLLGKLDDYLLALGHAQAQYATCTVPQDEVPAEFAKLRAVHSRFASDSEALVRRGLLPGERRVVLKHRPSRAHIAFDVLAMVVTFREHWEEIRGKTAITEKELDEADVQADLLLTAIGLRNMDALARIIHLRLAAFTMFARAYDQLRRGVSHLRWAHGDLEVLLPSLYSDRRGKGKSKKKKAAAEKAQAASNATPTSTDSDLREGPIGPNE